VDAARGGGMEGRGCISSHYQGNPEFVLITQSGWAEGQRSNFDVNFCNGQAKCLELESYVGCRK
jgi:hypothetical protein